MGFAITAAVEAFARFAPVGPVQHFALSCAALSLVTSVAAAVAVGRQRPGGSYRPTKGSHSVTFGRTSALLLGVAAATAQAVVLTMRVIYVSIEIVQGYPLAGPAEFGFGPGGLWSLGLLLTSNVISLLSTRDTRLAACLLWTGVMTALWACLLMPSFRVTATGGFERTVATLWILISLSALLIAAGLLSGWSPGVLGKGDGSFEPRPSGSGSAEAVQVPPLHGCGSEGEHHVSASDAGPLPHGRGSECPSRTRSKDRGRGRMVSGDADTLTDQRPQLPGLAAGCTLLAMAIGFLVCYHLLVPIRMTGGGYRGSALIATGSAAVAATACFLLLERGFTGSLADAGVGLASLGLCGAATLFVPSRVIVLADRYPMMFNAMIVGLACATALWTWLAEVWRQQLDRGGGRTRAGRLIPHAKRFAFLSAALALVAGVLMTFWPRLPGIATMDHSYGRVTAGFAANLFLLLVMLWSSRRLRRLSFHLLTLLAVLSTAGFLTMRMIPFASRLG